MPRVSVSGQLTRPQKHMLLRELEGLGSRQITPHMLNSLLHPLQAQLIQDREFLSRYLLLAATLDQQADSKSARETTVQLYTRYGNDLFLRPGRYLDDLYNIVGFSTQYYKPKTRILRMKAEGLILLRVGGYLLTLVNVEKRYGGLLAYLSQASSPRGLLNMVLNDTLLKGILYEKAARMYTGWVSHPKLWINISSGAWSVYEIPMVVNGHVCKVLARSGFLPDVLVESTSNMIVKAEDERSRIERAVQQYSTYDGFMVDFGAFYIGISYCDERKPNCNICPVNKLCIKCFVA